MVQQLWTGEIGAAQAEKGKTKGNCSAPNYACSPIATQKLFSFRISKLPSDEEIRRVDGSIHHHIKLMINSRKDTLSRLYLIVLWLILKFRVNFELVTKMSITMPSGEQFLYHLVNMLHMVRSLNPASFVQIYPIVFEIYQMSASTTFLWCTRWVPNFRRVLQIPLLELSLN